jgi:hypothetical protein
MFCEQFAAWREVSLVGAQIGGLLTFQGAELRPTNEASERSALAHRSREQSDGKIFLSGAHIGGDLDFTDAKLTLPPPDTDSEEPTLYRLNLERARVDGDLRVNFERARLSWARLGGLKDSEATVWHVAGSTATTPPRPTAEAVSGTAPMISRTSSTFSCDIARPVSRALG